MNSLSLTLSMGAMLANVAMGHPSRAGQPYQVSNTNRTAEALETRGLIEMAPDQGEARKTLCFAWVLTDAGRQYLGEHPYLLPRGVR